jgi:solute carrier family 50 protein (sugar transporter)
VLYGYSTGDIFPLFITYIVGELGALAFVSVHFWYSTAKAYAARAMVCAVTFIAATTLYLALAVNGVTNQSRDGVSTTVGWLTAAGSCLLYTSPFETIARVLRTKSAASIPIALCLASIVSNSLWVIYGFVIHDMFMVGLSVVCVALPVIQVVLYIVYRPARPTEAPADQGVEKERGFSALESPLSLDQVHVAA